MAHRRWAAVKDIRHAQRDGGFLEAPVAHRRIDKREGVFTPAGGSPVVVEIFSDHIRRDARAPILAAPAQAVVVAPLDVEGQAGVVEETGPRAGIRALLDDLGGERIEGEAAEARVAQAVAETEVHAAVKLEAEVAGDGADPGNAARSAVRRCGLARDLIGEEPTTLRREQIAGAEGGDDVGDLDVEEIHAEAQAPDSWHLEDCAGILHLTLLRFEVGISADGGSHLPRRVERAQGIEVGGGGGGIGLRRVKLADVGGLERLRIRAAQDDIEDAVGRQAELGGGLRLGGIAEIAVTFVSRRELKIEPLLHRHREFGIGRVTIPCAREGRRGGEADEVLGLGIATEFVVAKLIATGDAELPSAPPR